MPLRTSRLLLVALLSSSAPFMSAHAEVGSPASQPSPPAAPAGPPGASTQQAVTAPALPPALPATQQAAPAEDPAVTTQPAVVATTRPSALPSFTVDAMVGQVNGQALYASRILDPLDQQLRKLGRTGSRRQFAEAARQLIRARLEQIVLPSLLVGEAERALTDDERTRLEYIVKQQRAELLRLYGQGSFELADAVLREKTGKGFEQTLREKRQAILMANYASRKLLPKVNITQQDVQRYYRQHPEEFHRPPGRTIHMIATDDPAAAARIEAALAAATPFLEVAADAALNKHEPTRQGLLHENISGDRIFEDPTLNSATLALAVGEHTPKIQVGSRYYWVYLQALSTGQRVSLAEAQLQIERKLRDRQRQLLSNEYRQRLLLDGSYNPLPQMEQAVLEVALTRYAPPY